MYNDVFKRDFWTDTLQDEAEVLCAYFMEEKKVLSLYFFLSNAILFQFWLVFHIYLVICYGLMAKVDPHTDIVTYRVAASANK